MSKTTATAFTQQLYFAWWVLATLQELMSRRAFLWTQPGTALIANSVEPVKVIVHNETASCFSLQ